jgi:hypothetical protein
MISLLALCATKVIYYIKENALSNVTKDSMQLTALATLAHLDVLDAQMLIPALNAIFLSSYMTTLALQFALLETLLEDKPALNAILLAKLAMLAILADVLHAPVLTNYGKQDA